MKIINLNLFWMFLLFVHVWILFPFSHIGLFQKKTKQGGWGYGISRGVKEIACGISRGYYQKQSGISKGWPRKNHMRKFQGSWFLALEFPRDVTMFCGISKGGVLFCLEFHEKFQGVFQKSLSPPPSPPPPPPPSPSVVCFFFLE